MEQKQDKVFQVTLRGIAPWVSQVSYQKEDQDIKLYFALSAGTISEHDIIVANPEEPKQSAELQNSVRQLTGNSLAGLEYMPTPQLYITSLSWLDFERAHANSKILPDVCNAVSSRLGNGQGCLFLFQPAEHAPLRGLLRGGSHAVRQSVMNKFHGQEKGKWVLFSLPQNSPAEAKRVVLEILSFA
ncbi:MAG: hypothetical protein Q8P39_00390 [Candidatus Yanofskybacteria bacterium]|nr:hypothetical protein [Candidatus Yanofskybacteria bacterium]